MEIKKVAILALRNCNAASMIDAFAFFEKANVLCRHRNRPDAFAIQIVGETSDMDIERGTLILRPHAICAENVDADLIIIPALRGDLLSSNHSNRHLVDWIVKRYRQNCEIASLCTGAFMLAFTGLLANKRCTTHWNYTDEFRFYFPDVILVDEQMMVEQNGLYSSGGGNAYWNLLLFLAEKYLDREMSILLAKHFNINPTRTSQSPFIVFSGLKTHNDQEVLEAQQFIETNYPAKLAIQEIAEKFYLTRRTFERRFKKATHCTPLEYLQKVRIEASKKALEAGRKSIDEIMGDVGYVDYQAFRGLFKSVTGLTPVQYRDRYID